VLSQSHLDLHGLPLAFATLREPRAQSFRKTLRFDAKTRFDAPFGNGQSIVEVGRVGEIAHAKLIEPLDRANPRRSGNHHGHIKFLRVHVEQFSICPASERIRAEIFCKVQPFLKDFACLARRPGLLLDVEQVVTGWEKGPPALGDGLRSDR
jgi:hypothetical protein